MHARKFQWSPRFKLAAYIRFMIDSTCSSQDSVPGFFVSNLYEAVHVFGCALLAFTALLLIS
jgi:hypothetical protein